MRSSHHDDPAAQQRPGRTAEPSEQLGLGTMGLRRIAPDPVVMITRDQKPLVAERANQLARNGAQKVAEVGIGVRRAGESTTTS